MHLKFGQFIKSHLPFNLFAVVFLLATTICGEASAQQKINFDRLTIDDGLSQNSVQCIAQDKKGFMWFGTEDGLNRYDGYNFTIYKNNPVDSTSVSDNDIYSLLVDNEGILWVGTFNGGLNKFNPYKEEFKQINYDSSNTDKSGNAIILALLQDKKGNIWIGTYGDGLIKYNPKTKKSIHYKFNPGDPLGLSNNVILSLYEDLVGSLWIGTMGGGLDRYNEDEDNFSVIKHIPGDKNSLNSNRIWSILEDKNALWLGTMGGGLNQMDLKTHKVKRILYESDKEYTLGENQITSLLKDDKGNFWIGTYSGLNLYDENYKRFSRFVNDPLDQNSITNNSIRCLYEDNSGIIWIGTHGGGISKYVRSKIKFNSLNDIIPEISGEVVFSIFKSKENQDEIWLGTLGNGLVRYNFISGSTKVYTHNDENAATINSNFIQDITEDEYGDIWIGLLGGGLDKYDKKNDLFIHHTHESSDSNSLSGVNAQALYADKSGSLWIGTVHNGLNRFNLKTESFTHFRYSPDDTTSISSNIVRVIYKDKKGNLWVGTNGGLDKLIEGTNKFMRYEFDKNKNSISNNIIQSIYEEPGKEVVLWTGTYGGGIDKFEVAKNKFTNYKEKDGLPNNSVYEIRADKKDNLWISTNRGLTRFNLKTKKFRNYDINDGLLSNEFNARASFVDSKGTFYFGNDKGVNYFHPDSVTDNPFIPPVVITKLQIFNKDTKLDTSITKLKKLVLSYSDYVFSLEFASLDYSFPPRNRYQYMLKGFEKKWNDVSGRRYVTYTNLDPGKYVFEVKGSNSDYVWNERGASLTIIITPPFWQTWWFRGLIFLFAAFSVLYVINRIKVKEKRKTEINKKIYDLKIAALASQMKPHFVFNTINSIQYLISENKQKEALTYLSKFSELLRMTLENSLKSTVSLEREIQFLRLYLELEKLRFEDKFDYKIDIDEKINISSTEIPVMCIQPYVENAVIHGFKSTKEKGELKISFKQFDSSIKCLIMDNGMGYKNAIRIKSVKERKSLGMAITKERIELLSTNNKNAEVKIIDIGDESNSETGTRVEIVLPVEVNF